MGAAASVTGGLDGPRVEPGTGVPMVAGGGAGGGVVSPVEVGPGAHGPAPCGDSGSAPQVRTACARASAGEKTSNIAKKSEPRRTQPAILPVSTSARR
jgi:hypothetical protein